ncbi:NfeD family protein [Thermoactinomyces mirandus]|nr:NfeD family protein [Thermoactinomyces mirandus]
MAFMVFTDFLADPVVMMIILAVGLLGLMIELLSPGVGIAAIIGLGCFATFFGTCMHLGSASMFEVFLFIVGSILIVIEVLLPTLGILGIIGIIMVIVSIVAAIPDLNVAVLVLVGSLAITGICLWILFRFFGWKVTWNRVILRTVQSNEKGYTSSRDRKALLNQVGITLTPLRPSGFAQFGDHKEDVVSDGESIPRDVKVKVILVEGSRVVVKRAEQNED